LHGLSYEECLPIVRELLKDRMTWIWSEDIDVAYDNAKS
jgi:salicylate hydroxylase